LSNFKPIKQSRVSEQVLDQLKEAILLGKFKSGDKLPSERELTMQFQVSRGVIREAIRTLEITGFIVIRQGQNGGAFVTDLSFDHLGNAFLDLFLSNKLSIPELVHVRNYIEPEVTRLAAINGDDDDKRRLIEAQKLEFIPWNTYMERVNHFQKVHLVLAEICGNHFFEAITKSMLRLTREIVEAVEPDHETLHPPGEHREIIDAVMKGDPDAAKSFMKRHLDQFGLNLVKMEESYRIRSAQKKKPDF
jgi:GntR family transcriptional repressor for pyruvate dehydrogenase complex